MGGTGRLLGKTFFLHYQKRYPELPKIPTYLPVHDFFEIALDSVVMPSESVCDCSSEVGIPTVLGFASAKEIDEWHKLFGPECVVLTQHMERRTLAPWPHL